MISKMDKNYATLLLAFLVFASLPVANAYSYSYGYYDGGSGSGIAAFFIIFFIVIISAIIFTLWMLIDCIRREFKDRVLWILIILLVGLIGSIIYYFMIKRKNVHDNAGDMPIRTQRQVTKEDKVQFIVDYVKNKMASGEDMDVVLDDLSKKGLSAEDKQLIIKRIVT